MLDIDTSDRKEQRKFGFVLEAAFVILGLIRVGIRFITGGAVAVPWPFLIIGLCFALPAAVFPALLRPVFIVWIKFALMLNWIMTQVLLTVVYYMIIVPMGGGMRLLAMYPLKRKWLAPAETYWEEAEEQPEEFERYHHQF